MSTRALHTWLPLPTRISPRLLRPLLLVALFVTITYLGHLSIHGGKYALKRRGQALLKPPGEVEGGAEEGDEEFGILPIYPYPEPKDVVPEWLDASEKHDESQTPTPPITPWLPNPFRSPIDFPSAVLESPDFMYNTSIPELAAVPPPSMYACRDSDSFGPMLLIGVFTTADSWAQRSVLRALQRRGMNARSPWVEFKFVLGKANETQVRERRLVELEQEAHGDLVVLDMEENMEDGKTYAFFEWASRLPEGEQPRFVMKADQDTLLVMPNVLASFASLSCNTNLYWGTFWGSCFQCYPLYMRGLAYALSWPLVAWLGSAHLSGNDTNGMEDIRTGGWFTSLPPGELVEIVDWGIHMGDWYGETIPHDVHTVALHAMKDPESWIEVAHEIVDIWRKEGWEYTWPPTDH